MSLGTITIDNDEGRSGGPYPLTLMQFAGDDSYPAGGTPNFQQLVRDVFKINLEVVAVLHGECGDCIPTYDKANDKLIVRLLSTGQEAGAGVNLSGTIFNVVVLGK